MAKPDIMKANQQQANKPCPFCTSPIILGDDIAVCRDCSAVLHESCWRENGGCSTYGCASSPAGRGEEISVVPAGTTLPRRTSGLALASLLIAALSFIPWSFSRAVSAAAIIVALIAIVRISWKGALKGRTLAIIAMAAAAVSLVLLGGFE